MTPLPPAIACSLALSLALSAAPPAGQPKNPFWVLAPSGAMKRVELKSVRKGALLLFHTPDSGWAFMRVTKSAYFDRDKGSWTVEGEITQAPEGPDL